MDYSLFIMETVEMSLGVMETTPTTPRRSLTPPICSTSSLFWCFYVLAALPSGKRRGTIFIVIFRSRESFGKKDRRKRSHEGPDGVPTRPRNLATWATPFRPSGLHIFASFFPTLFFLRKNDPRKFSGHLDVVWVPETSKYRKQGFLSVQG